MDDEAASICIAPLSSPYSILQRAHTYTLVLALLLPLPKGWFFRAALATFTTRTAVAVIDIIVLYTHLYRHQSSSSSSSSSPGDSASNGSAAPLDVLVVAEYLALATLVAVFLLSVSRRGAETAARGILRAWAIAVGIGAVIGFLALLSLARIKTEGECTQTLLSYNDIYGEKTSYGANLGKLGTKIGFFILRIGIPAVLFAAMTFVASLSPTLVPSTSSRNSSSSSSPSSSHRHNDVQGLESQSSNGNGRSYDQQPGKIRRFLRLLLTLAIPAMSIFVVANAEWYFHRLAPQVPSVESVTSVGQWGIWAATGVVALAALVGAITHNREGRDDGDGGGDGKGWKDVTRSKKVGVVESKEIVM